MNLEYLKIESAAARSKQKRLRLADSFVLAFGLRHSFVIRYWSFVIPSSFVIRLPRRSPTAKAGASSFPEGDRLERLASERIYIS